MDVLHEGRGKSVYYLGPKGSFSHMAALSISKTVENSPSITAVFENVEKFDSLGVVPIENSIEGPVHETLDNLFNRDRVYVNLEIEIPISLVLASKSPVDRIKRIYSHEHALGEASSFLKKSNVEVVKVQSTSRAAELASIEPDSAAICSPFAAESYGLKVLIDNVSDHTHNSTRFVVISSELKKDGKKTMLMFTVEDRPGSLYKVLKSFYVNNLNLSMIYSRPVRTTPWHYYFYLEVESSLSDEPMRNALEEMGRETSTMKIKGSFYRLSINKIP